MEPWNSLAARWLGLSPHCHGLGSAPGQGTEIHTTGPKKRKNETLVGGRGVWGLFSVQLCCEPKAAPKIKIYLKRRKTWCSVIGSC